MWNIAVAVLDGRLVQNMVCTTIVSNSLERFEHKVEASR